MAYIVLSAYEQGITGFEHLFLNAFIFNRGWNFGDFFLLDWWLRAVYTDRVSLPENRNHEMSVREDVKVACWYGEKEGHMKNAVEKLQKAYPRLTVRCFEGYGHRDIMNHPEQLVSEIVKYIQ